VRGPVRQARFALLFLAALAAPAALPAAATGQEAPKAPAPASKAASGQAGSGKPAVPPATPAFDKVARQALEAHAAQKLDEALALYQKALRIRPRWSEGRFALGTVLYDLDRYEEARAEFRRVTAEQPKSGAAWAFKGMCEFQLKNLEGALADLEKGRALGLGANPSLKAVADYHTAVLFTRFGEFELAQKMLRDFALTGRDTPGVIEALGLAALRMPYLPAEAPADKREMIVMAGRALFEFTKSRYSPTARLAFEELVRRYPEEPNTHYANGAFLLSLEERETALAEFRRVLDMDPVHVPAMLQLALTLIKEGQHEQALPYAEKAVATKPDFFAAHNALGRALLELDQVDRAIQELETAARLAPTSAQTYFALTRAYQRAGRKEDMERARATFVKLDKALRAEYSTTRAEGQSQTLEPTPPQE
jgi:tetratricopeptide (TPR) repeat protein